MFTPLTIRELVAIGVSILSLVYFAGVQGNRLDTIQSNQQRVLLKLEELTKSDADLKAELEKIKGHLEARGIGYGYRYSLR